MGIAASHVNDTMVGSARGDDVINELRLALIVAGWTQSLSDDTDGNAITTLGSGVGGIGQSDAWIVMAKPTTGVAPINQAVQVGFQRGTSDRSWKVKIYPEGDASFDTATTLPTGTNTFFVQGQQNADTYQNVFGTGLNRFHIIILDAAEGHGFNVLQHNNGATTFSNNGMLGMDPIMQHHPDDTHPWVHYADDEHAEGNRLFQDGKHGVTFIEQPETTVETLNFSRSVNGGGTVTFPGSVAQYSPSADEPVLQAMYVKQSGRLKGLSTFWYVQGPARSLGFMFTDGGQSNAYVAFGDYATRFNEAVALIL